MIWKYACCTSKRAHFSASHIFHLKVLKDPGGKKKSHWNQSKWRRRESRKIRKGRRFSRDPVLRNVKRRCRHCGLQARKGPAAGFSPVPEYPQSLDPHPFPPGPGGGTGSWGTALPTAGNGEGTGTLFTFWQGRLEGTPGPQLQSPPSHTPLRPCPPSTEAGPSLTVSLGGGLGVLGDKRELTLGLRPAEGRRTRT